MFDCESGGVREGGWGKGEQLGKKWDNCTRTTIKLKKKHDV